MAISVENSGWIAAAGEIVSLNTTGFSGLGIQATGSWTGTLQFEGSVDGETFVSLGATPPSGVSSAVTSTTGVGAWQAACHGLKIVRVRASAFAAGLALIWLHVDPDAGGGGGSSSGGGAVTVADGADVAEGATTDAKVLGDNAGTVSAKLRGLNTILNNVWDSVNNWLKVSIQNASIAVTGLDTTVTGTLTENATSTSIAMAGQRGVALVLGADGFSAATVLTPQISYDGGTTWTTGPIFVAPFTATQFSTLSLGSGLLSNTQWTLAYNGSATHIRLLTNASGASGSIPYTLKATTTAPLSIMFGRDGSTIRPVLLDTSGRALTGSKELPDATSTFAPTNATSTAYETSRVAKAAAGTLYSVNGYNARTSAQFIHVHDAAALPANGAVPVVIFLVQASANFSYSADKFGRFCSTGITVCNSSTGPTKTIGSADCWFDVQYN